MFAFHVLVAKFKTPDFDPIRPTLMLIDRFTSKPSVLTRHPVPTLPLTGPKLISHTGTFAPREGFDAVQLRERLQYMALKPGG